MGEKFSGWEVFDYLDWLLSAYLYTDKIDTEVQEHYIRILHSFPFEYDIRMDENRYDDGIQLRFRYINECNVPDIFDLEEVECSVLEMLAALSIRCSEDIMGETPGFWFWDWVENLFRGVDMDDEEAVFRKISNWINRKFNKNGVGSPFPRRNAVIEDQRKVEIWNQMLGYLSENYLGLD